MAVRQTDLTNYARKADLASLPMYVNNGDFQTIAQLKANFPAAQNVLGRLARVSDLWTSVRTTMVCEFDGQSYYWRPQRTDYAVPMTMTSGTVNLIPLITAPNIIMKATLLGSMTLALKTDDVWPGCSFTVKAPATLGLFTMNFSGLVGGLVTGILGGNTKTAIYTQNGWEVN